MEPAPAPADTRTGPDPALESLVRPVLELVGAMTGLESTYLTTVDPGPVSQTVLFARNAAALEIPEGLTVPWADTLCRRALEEGHPFESDVPARWGDSDIARALGIRTYISSPVRSGDGRLYGTLCGTSTRGLAIEPSAREVLDMASRLIGLHLEREHLVTDLRRANAELAELAESALTDPMTGLPNRRAVTLELGRMLARAERDGMAVFATSIDLGDFEHIDERHGHGAGDHFLRAMGVRLEAGLRGGDLVARLGDASFVVVGAVPRETADASAEVVSQRLAAQTAGTFDVGGVPLAYPGASVGLVVARIGEFDPDALLARADAAVAAARRGREGET